MAFTLCTDDDAFDAAGLNANSTFTGTSAAMDRLSNQVEAHIVTLMKYDVVANYGSLTSTAKVILNELSAAMIAKRIISYDASGYTSRAEAELMLDVLESVITRCENMVKNDEFKKFLGIQ